MTNSSLTHPLTQRRPVDRGRHPLLTALHTRLRAAALDRALIAGADPSSTDSLAARAARLTAAPTRRALADGVDARLRALDEPSSRWHVTVRRAPLRANATALRELAERLRGSALLAAPGIAAVSELLSDGTGPLYGGDASALAGALSATIAALTPAAAR